MKKRDCDPVGAFHNEITKIQCLACDILLLLIRSSRTDAGSSLGSWETSSPRKRGPRMDCVSLSTLRFRLAITGFERGGGFEKCFDAADDFLLFGERRNR